jgi:hypothetical protein
MALSKEEQEQLDALTAKANAPEEDEDFEMEIYDGSKGARVPYRKGRSWLQQNFGIDLDPNPGNEADDDGKDSAGKNGGKPGKAQGKESGTQPDPNPAGRTGHWSGRIDRHQAS